MHRVKPCLRFLHHPLGIIVVVSCLQQKNLGRVNQAKYLGPSFGGERGREEGEVKVGQRGRGGEEQCKTKNNTIFPHFLPSLFVLGATGWKPAICAAREGRLGAEILRERHF